MFSLPSAQCMSAQPQSIQTVPDHEVSCSAQPQRISAQSQKIPAVPKHRVNHAVLRAQPRVSLQCSTPLHPCNICNRPCIALITPFNGSYVGHITRLKLYKPLYTRLRTPCVTSSGSDGGSGSGSSSCNGRGSLFFVNLARTSGACACRGRMVSDMRTALTE